MKHSDPAFPVCADNPTDKPLFFAGSTLPANSTVTYAGMTLRDYFAAKAMHAMLNQPETKADGERALREMFAELSRLAYLQADAMLAERAKGTP